MYIVQSHCARGACAISIHSQLYAYGTAHAPIYTHTYTLWKFPLKFYQYNNQFFINNFFILQNYATKNNRLLDFGALNRSLKFHYDWYPTTRVIDDERIKFLSKWKSWLRLDFVNIILESLFISVSL